MAVWQRREGSRVCTILGVNLEMDLVRITVLLIMTTF